MFQLVSHMLRQQLERFGRNRVLRRRLPAGFGSRPIWVSPDARLRFLRLGAAAFDPELLQYVQRYVNPGDLVWDIGANVGEFSLAASHRVGEKGCILAVEPDPVLASLMQRTLSEQENADAKISLLCAAVSSNCGIADFSVASRARAANSLSVVEGSTQSGGTRYRFKVPLISLDELLAWTFSPTLVKIDVEGAEALALRGAERILKGARPTILIEVSEATQVEVTDQLRRSDYALFDASISIARKEIERCVFNTLAIPREKLSVPR